MQEKPKAQLKMDNPVTLAILGTKDRTKTNKTMQKDKLQHRQLKR
jgi:hypothetical protein